MTKLDEMWVEFEKHQSIANDSGYGKAWAEMCKLRTVEACLDADYAAAAYAAAAAAAEGAAAAAAYAAAAAAVYAYAGYAEAAGCAKASKYAEYCMQKAIELINKATGEIK